MIYDWQTDPQQLSALRETTAREGDFDRKPVPATVKDERKASSDLGYPVKSSSRTTHRPAA